VSASAEWPYVQSRGLTGLDGLLAYWRAHGALCDAIVSTLAMDTLRVDVTVSDWPERRARVCAFLCVPADEPPSADARDLQPLAGHNRAGDREASITLEDGRLVLRGVLWPVNALLPVTADVFDVEAWPFRMSFERSADGAGRAFRWSGPRLWWGGPEGTYRRSGTDT
jgi:hypothetical protein